MHKAFVITDLTFGDAGKGTITDALARRGASLVVRYNGGAQAAHTVLDEAGHCHIFHQFGSGTLVDGVETLLSRHMLFNPIALHYEERALDDLGVTNALERIYVDARALVTTPYHTILNQLRELARGDRKHGSCGLGIGETAADALDFENQVLRFGDLTSSTIIERKLRWHRDLKRRQLEALPAWDQFPQGNEPKARQLLDQLHSEDELEATQEVFEYISSRVQGAPPDFLATRMQKPGGTVFEGAQGVLLDENRGFHPYTTWSTTTPTNALQLIAETGLSVQTTVLGLTRAYQTRHGAGPFPTEAPCVTQALPDAHNPTNEWQGPFRAGWLDLALLRYAIKVSGRIDGLIVTCLDRLKALPEAKVATGYKLAGSPWNLTPNNPASLEHQERLGEALQKVTVTYETLSDEPMAYAKSVAQKLALPLLGTSCGPTAKSKSFDF